MDGPRRATENPGGMTAAGPSPAGNSDEITQTTLAAIPDLSTSMELVRKFQAGDEAALNELFERYKPRLQQIVRIRMGNRLQRHLDDVMSGSLGFGDGVPGRKELFAANRFADRRMTIRCYADV